MFDFLTKNSTSIRGSLYCFFFSFMLWLMSVLQVLVLFVLGAQ
uniref:Uncharacterized protein n=1 Tax=Arundo donax TaxID=35708 RepID=A0A0A9BAQ2_ARUDO